MPIAPPENAPPEKASSDHADLVSQVHEHIRNLIVRGRLAPGMRIVEATVAKRFGISRTPVRAALQRLQQEGYVNGAIRAQRARPIVTSLTFEDARELFSIIGEIEGLGAECTAELESDRRKEIAAELGRINHEYLRVATSPSPEADEIFAINSRFHAMLFDAASGPRLRALHTAIAPQTERYVRVYQRSVLDAVRPAVEEHSEIIAALETGDVTSVHAAMRSHWQKVATRLKKEIGTRGEIGTL